MEYPHLIETTVSWCDFRLWTLIAPGYTYDDLTEEEKRVYEESVRIEKGLEEDQK